MTTGPHLRPPWTTLIGPNRYQRARLTFARRWLDEPTATHNDMLIFEADLADVDLSLGWRRLRVGCGGVWR